MSVSYVPRRLFKIPSKNMWGVHARDFISLMNGDTRKIPKGSVGEAESPPNGSHSHQAPLVLSGVARPLKQDDR